jgi:hypothetical protein
MNLKGFLEWNWGPGTKLSDIDPEERDVIPDVLRMEEEE